MAGGTRHSSQPDRLSGPLFSNLEERFLDSPVVLGVIVGIVLLYVLILLWARRQDKKDQDMVSLQHLLTQLLTQCPGVVHETFCPFAVEDL